MAKTTLDFAKLVNKLYTETCSNGREVIGTIFVSSYPDHLGGLDVERVYEFANYRAKDHCSFDKEDIHEFRGAEDAFSYLRMRLLPSVTLEQISGNTSEGLRIKARKTILGQDPIV